MTSSNGNIFRVTDPLCGEFTGPGEFPTQRPVTRSFDVFFDLRLNKRLSKQPWGWWYETASWSLWRHCNATANNFGAMYSREMPMKVSFKNRWPFYSELNMSQKAQHSLSAVSLWWINTLYCRSHVQKILHSSMVICTWFRRNFYFLQYNIEAWGVDLHVRGQSQQCFIQWLSALHRAPSHYLNHCFFESGKIRKMILEIVHVTWLPFDQVPEI